MVSLGSFAVFFGPFDEYSVKRIGRRRVVFERLK